MDNQKFLNLKVELSNKISELIIDPNLTFNNKESLLILLSILNEYKFENRLEFKGLLSHAVVDILNNDLAIGDDLIKFDQSIY